ncbi:UNVERIFIED_CONTAM: hypothetical protein PYX00_010873 [Menopon gallinae]|uniref:Translation initiation factor 3 N-terminal domain-containing protein n=1 Tax=Menopon gallinae TaxID=328185 RepID=A0AAW2H6A3_9NEOP
MAGKDLRINEEITAKEVRLIKQDGTQTVLPFGQALLQAQEASLDLVEVSPSAIPPVCRILDYGKYKFEQEKRAKESKKKQKVIKVKEIRMQAKISNHDLDFKAKHGRELAHTDLGRAILQRMLDMINTVKEAQKALSYVLEQAPKMEGRSMYMVLAPKKD